MPPSGFSKKATAGLLQFVQGCYEDLLEEVRAGKHNNVEEAIEHEISQIDTALSKMHINDEGELVERP